MGKVIVQEGSQNVLSAIIRESRISVLWEYRTDLAEHLGRVLSVRQKRRRWVGNRHSSQAGMEVPVYRSACTKCLVQRVGSHILDSRVSGEPWCQMGRRIFPFMCLCKKIGLYFNKVENQLPQKRDVRSVSEKHYSELGTVVNVYNPSTQEVETGVQGHLELHEVFSPKSKNKIKTPLF